MSTTSENNKRIAKNTLLLYARMLLLMFISLYTSRVVLKTLGVVDFGIYNVVGGVVAMFSMLSGSLSAAITRFLTYDLGKNDSILLEKTFCSSVVIQTFLAIIIVILAEVIGVWFLNYKMVIPVDRIYAANWVLQFSIMVFAVGLIGLPCNAILIAHEKMSVFAYIGILEAIGKLVIAYLIMVAPIDNLIFYSMLLFILALIVNTTYGVYCYRNFMECRFRIIWDVDLLKKMFGFAGWNFIGASSAVLRDHGGNIVINLFFGPSVNAARGIAVQVQNAVSSFVNNFMTALNPQITKSYASGNNDYMMNLIFLGARFSYYILLVLGLPVLINTHYILHIWLENVPEHTVNFVRLIILFVMSESISNPLITAMLATGNIRNYQIVVGGLQMMNLPISYLLLRMGFVPEYVLVVAIAISQACLIVRLIMLRAMISLEIKKYIKDVYLNILGVSFVSIILPLIICYNTMENLCNFLLLCFVSFLSVCITVIFIGCNSEERNVLLTTIKKKINDKNRR